MMPARHCSRDRRPATSLSGYSGKSPASGSDRVEADEFHYFAISRRVRQATPIASRATCAGVTRARTIRSIRFILPSAASTYDDAYDSRGHSGVTPKSERAYRFIIRRHYRHLIGSAMINAIAGGATAIITVSGPTI